MSKSEFIDIDFETKSETGFEKGTYKYAAHPSTKILMISFSEDQKTVFNWNPYYPIAKNYRKLKKIIRRVKRGRAIFRATNSEFEYWIWNLVGRKQFGWPEISYKNFIDAAVISCIAGFPAKLEHAALAVGCDTQKDTSGTALINFFSKPSRKKGEVAFNNPKDHKRKFLEFVSYCDDDVYAQIGVVEACPPMTKRQHEIYLLTEKMNLRGLPIDIPMAKGALKLVGMCKETADREIRKITKGKIESATQNIMLHRWLNAKGCDIPNLQAATIERYIKNPKTKALHRKALQNRANVSKSSTAKYKAALDYVSERGVVHGFLKPLMAKTGRWVGRGLQIHNFSKPDITFPLWCDYELLAEAIAQSDRRFIETIYGDAMEALKAATRSMICAPEGFKFIAADYAQIEARIVMWLAGDSTGMADFEGEGKIYESMASEVFGTPMDQIAKPSFERDVGKEAVLGCGFGMGWGTFVFRCVEQLNLAVEDETGKRAVKGYRNRYKHVPLAWRQCEGAAVRAIQNPGHAFTACETRLAYKKKGRFLIVQLPSKRKLYYPDAKVELEVNQWGQEQNVIYYRHWDNKNPVGKKWGYEKIWGGTLFQHGVQATAVDIMAHGMLNAELRGYPALFTVHDEALAKVRVDFGSVKEYEGILCALEPWAQGLRIVAEGWEGPRYRK